MARWAAEKPLVSEGNLSQEVDCPSPRTRNSRTQESRPDPGEQSHGLGWGGKKRLLSLVREAGDGEAPAVQPLTPLIWKTVNPQKIKNL